MAALERLITDYTELRHSVELSCPEEDHFHAAIAAARAEQAELIELLDRCSHCFRQAQICPGENMGWCEMDSQIVALFKKQGIDYDAIAEMRRQLVKH